MEPFDRRSDSASKRGSRRAQRPSRSCFGKDRPMKNNGEAGAKKPRILHMTVSQTAVPSKSTLGGRAQATRTVPRIDVRAQRLHAHDEARRSYRSRLPVGDIGALVVRDDTDHPPLVELPVVPTWPPPTKPPGSETGRRFRRVKSPANADDASRIHGGSPDQSCTPTRIRRCRHVKPVQLHAGAGGAA